MLLEGFFRCARPVLVAVAVLFAGCSAQGAERWWKGNLHTHSLWSDGDNYPEMIAAWYKEHGYHFLSMSDHNVVLEGEKWVHSLSNRGGADAFAKYLRKFGPAWVHTRTNDAQVMVRLKTLEEFRGRLEEPGRFLMIPGEEISDRFEKIPIHLNASNLKHLIRPQGGQSVREVIQNNIDAVLAQRKETGQIMIPHVNHPNFGWALTAEDMAPIEGERFFEVYNGHPGVRNYGDTNRASTDRMWDIILTRRLAELGLPAVWGTAVDDAHNYHTIPSRQANPGRGWVVVRAAELRPEAIIQAMEAGDFYASTGVRLKSINRLSKGLGFEIEAERGVTYQTQFIGTRVGYDPASTGAETDGKPLRTTRIYSSEIGAVLAETDSLSPRYTFKGDEIYVRAKVTSSKLKENGFAEGDTEVAWVQPWSGK